MEVVSRTAVDRKTSGGPTELDVGRNYCGSAVRFVRFQMGIYIPVASKQELYGKLVQLIIIPFEHSLCTSPPTLKMRFMVL